MKRGIIRGRTVDEQEAELKDLFELDDINDEPEFALAARRSNASEASPSPSSPGSPASAAPHELSSSRRPFPPASSRSLAAELPRILTAPENFRDLPDLFAQAGVRLVYVEALPGAKIDGCAFFLDGTPVIGLSGRGKRMDKIIFTLLHETAHLTLGHVKPGPDHRRRSRTATPGSAWENR